MTPAEITAALGQHLETMTDCPPIVWPNKTDLPDGFPYLTFQMAALGSSDDTLTGTARTRTGRLVIVAVYPLNSYATQAQVIAEAIEAHFPRGNIGGVTVTLAQVLGGYTTETDYRVPVAIDWTA